ncbi:VPLPA-CTERM sorting domain-containing protein [Ruegeria sp. WL0004]|uniref:VPLPA-CTERM sorting domain-containing protein n=1 Tax=Ruegeria marisflavi TaxID=2984152 RepID=A0ABT2WXG9_9RHOB|nr:VPLPA-CTERM sorting domain-containing protein [Ruegeria sp. WL0004]MCU9840604.1 VPLPA-CTERM sorting domain-containing protein [Ruegeria sp. WL0004]
MKLVLAVAFSVLAGAASATTQYSDRTAFEAATASLTTETFNGFTSDVSLAATTFDVGDFSIATTLNNSILKIDADGADSHSVNGSAFVRGVGLPGDMFTYIFDTAITAFGVDLFGFNDFEERTRVVINGNTYTLPVVNGVVNSFFGFTSGTAFTSVSFNVIAGGEDGGFDNISYGAVAPVPVPAAGLLLLSGFGALGAIARRRKSRAKG